MEDVKAQRLYDYEDAGLQLYLSASNQAEKEKAISWIYDKAKELCELYKHEYNGYCLKIMESRNNILDTIRNL